MSGGERPAGRISHVLLFPGDDCPDGCCQCCDWNPHHCSDSYAVLRQVGELVTDGYIAAHRDLIETYGRHVIPVHEIGERWALPQTLTAEHDPLLRADFHHRIERAGLTIHECPAPLRQRLIHLLGHEGRPVGWVAAPGLAAASDCITRSELPAVRAVMDETGLGARMAATALVAARKYGSAP